MRLAGSTLIYAKSPLAETLRNLNALGFSYAEIDFFNWGHIDPAEVINQPEESANEIRQACQDAAITPIALSLGLHGPLDAQLQQLEASTQVARDLEVSHLTIQAAPKETPLEEDVERVRQFCKVVKQNNLDLSIETHLFMHTEAPLVALHYVREVQSLGITLDPSHYAAGPYWQDGFNNLLPYVRYLHIRSAGRSWAEIQQPAGTGSINYAELLEVLKMHGFRGDASIEYVEGAPGVDSPSTEARRMRELIEALLHDNR